MFQFIKSKRSNQKNKNTKKGENVISRFLVIFVCVCVICHSNCVRFHTSITFILNFMLRFKLVLLSWKSFLLKKIGFGFFSRLNI